MNTIIRKKETLDQSRLNYEEQNQYKIRIQFRNQTNIFEENFFIHIEDVNEPPYYLQCSNYTGFCTALDEDFNQTLKFQIKLFKNFDYEIICTDNGQPPLSVSTWIKVLPDDLTIIFVPIYSLIIPVVDDNNNNNNHKIDKERKDNTVMLYFNDGNKTERQRRQANSPPQDIYFNKLDLTIPENSRYYQIASVHVIDDNDNNNYTCSVFTYDIPDNYQPFEINNGILQTSSTMQHSNYNLNFETVPIYHITVTCDDPIHHLTIAKDFYINVNDVNEGPVELSLIPNTLPENSDIGYVIGRFYTIDPDIFAENQTFEYTIVTDVNHMFKIENDQLILNRNNQVNMCISKPDLCPHDYEQINSLYVRIRVEDNGQPRSSQKFWIEIKLIDENDPPINLQIDINLIEENSPIGTLIGSFSVQDQDLYQIHTFHLLNEIPLLNNGNVFFIEDNYLRLARIPDYEQEQLVIITVQAIDNGTIPKNITNDFIIEIHDLDEFPSTYIFIPNIEGIISNDTINDLIDGKQPIQTNYLPQNLYFENSIGRIAFLIEDRNRDINLNGSNYTNNNQLAFSKPICYLLTENPYRLLCTSIICVENPRSISDNNDDDGYLIITSINLIINNNMKTFEKLLRIKFENIILTINDILIETIDIPKDNSTNFHIGIIHAIDLATTGQPMKNVTLNSNISLSYPLEIINSTLLKIRNDVNFSLINSSLIFNVSLFVIINDEDNRTIEKFLMINIKDKMDFKLILTNNKIMENSHENILIGNFIIEDGYGDYIIYLLNNSNGRFKLNGTNLLTAKKSVEHCQMNHSCLLNYETEPRINITIAIEDPLTNKTLRIIDITIEIEDENESPYNLTLSIETILENTPINSIIGFIHGIDDDFNQTLTFITDNPIFDIINNQLILKINLNSYQRKFIPLIIRAIDNGRPSISIEKFFLINITTINRSPINITRNSMIVYLLENQNLTSIIVGQIYIIDPDIKENFTFLFNIPNYYALIPTMNSYSIIADDGSMAYAQVYNISIVDLNPPNENNKSDYLVNITANITDSGNHSILYEFFVQYIRRSRINSTITSSIPSLTTTRTTTTTPSLSEVLHVRIYETTPSNIPIIHGLLTSSLSNNFPTCNVTDDENILFPINTTHSTFLIYLPNNYTLNSTIRSIIVLNLRCHIVNNTNIRQDIVIDVLPAPPPLQINFNQTKQFYAINNHTILGTFSTIELTKIPTNRTFNLTLINHQDIFQLLSNGSLIQIGPYSTDLLQNFNPHINLTIQSIETTLNEPMRIIQTTFSFPIIFDFSIPIITFSSTSIPYNTNPNTIIGNLTVYYLTISYHLELNNTYNNSLELDPITYTITLKKSLNTLSLIHNQTQLIIKINLMNEINQIILTEEFPLRIIYTDLIHLCLEKDCGNGTCIQLNQSSSYCLCRNGYTGMTCQINDPCTYNSCLNNGICHQLISTNDFSCECLPNYSGLFCEILIDICQINKNSCLSTEICIPINNNLTNFFTCVSNDKLEYLVFDYLNNYKTIDIINDESLFKKIEDFIRNYLYSIENFILYDKKILGPEKYNRAELLSIVILSSNLTLNDALKNFCQNQILINKKNLSIDSFIYDICSSYQQTIYLNEYFKSIPNFCPNCSFIDAANKYYWFDKIIPFLPLYIILIIGSILLAVISLIPLHSNVSKKFVLPLMKARMCAEDNKGKTELILTKSVRTEVKLNDSSSRKRNDSGYESNEDNENYFEQIIKTSQKSQYYVYPVFNSTNLERHGTIIDDLMSSNTRRKNSQRSVSMSTDKIRRQSLFGTSQTLKPILQRRSTLFDSSIGRLISLTGTPRLNNDDDTYLSRQFHNENTSKFVIGTLWNTFALVNNLFLQRPRKRRNALSNEINLQAEQLAHLQELYTQAELDQDKNISTNNLRSIIYEILSSTKESHCNCYDNHHRSSCIYYDHSLPYIKRFINHTKELEKIFHDIHKTNQPKCQDASTQSYLEKPIRIFTHFKTTNHVATQSSPILNRTINISTQTIENNNINNLNISKQSIIEDIPTKKANISTINHSKNIDNDNVYNRRHSLINELKQVLTSSNSKFNEQNNSPSNHTVRSLVSMFETTSALKNSHSIISSQKSITNLPKVLTPPDSILLNISTEDIHSSIVQYANEIASNIVDNAVLTATTTPVYHSNEQLQRRFSFYNNAGGYGKSLLFQSNTFVPSNQEEINENIRVDSQLSNILLDDPIPITTENEPQHTLIVGRYVDGNESSRKTQFDFDSLLSSDDDDDEQHHRQQFLSNSQLLSAQKLYIHPWLVRRSTTSNIHSFDNDINDTRIEINNSFETYFNIFPKNMKYNLDLYTRYTCLITMLVYLYDIHDEYSNKILYHEIENIDKQLNNSSSSIHSNVFQTINPNGNKRYRTGFIVDINSSSELINKRKILSKQIQWKRVKIIIRRFRKKYLYYKQLMKNDEKISLNYFHLENYLNIFDSTSKRRIKKYAKHYAEKL